MEGTVLTKPVPSCTINTYINTQGFFMKLAVAVFLVLTLSACSTVKGIGQDITNGADWVQKKI